MTLSKSPYPFSLHDVTHQSYLNKAGGTEEKSMKQTGRMLNQRTSSSLQALWILEYTVDCFAWFCYFAPTLDSVPTVPSNGALFFFFFTWWAPCNHPRIFSALHSSRKLSLTSQSIIWGRGLCVQDSRDLSWTLVLKSHACGCVFLCRPWILWWEGCTCLICLPHFWNIVSTRHTCVECPEKRTDSTSWERCVVMPLSF